MKIVKASSLDAHDRRRFNELRSNVFADGVVELEFHNFIEKAQATPWLRNIKVARNGRQLELPATRKKAVRT